MLGKIIAHEEEDFKQWLASSKAPASDLPPAEHGAKLVQQNACLTCHSLDGSRMTGPSFQGIFGREEHMSDGSTVTVDENYIRESILEPKAKVVEGYQPVMPTYQGSMSDTEINAIIEYLKQQK
jgi:cytochrome c oxidase subunit 2